MPTNWSNEFQFLLAACRAGLSDADILCDEEHQAETLDQLDWNRVVELAARHRVLPQLHARLSHGSPTNCPVELRSNVHARTKLLMQRGLLLSAELIRIVGKFENSGIDCLTFKGPSLAKLAYGNLASRTFSDIDILVSEAEFVSAIECLSQLGYTSFENLDFEQQQFQMRSKGEILFAHPSGSYVDLHTSLSRGTYAYQVSWTKLWDNRQTLEMQGAKLATFGASDLCLYLAIHGAKHRWTQLNWILDFALTTRQYDLKQSLSSADAIGERKVLQLGFLICAACLGPSNEESKRLAGKPDGRQVKLLKELKLSLENGACPDSRISDLVYLFRARQRPLAAVLATIAEITTPHLTDWNAVRLPRSLWFCYVIIRPLRLLWKRLGSHKTSATNGTHHR